VVFDFRMGREREGPKQFLGQFKGLLQTDRDTACEDAVNLCLQVRAHLFQLTQFVHLIVHAQELPANQRDWHVPIQPRVEVELSHADRTSSSSSLTPVARCPFS